MRKYTLISGANILMKYGTPDTSLDIDIEDLENSSEHNEILSKPFTIDEILKYIKLLKNNKASASDLIWNEMIRKWGFYSSPSFL